MARDNTIRNKLIEEGWRAGTVWECALRAPRKTAAAVELLSAWILSSEREIEIGEEDLGSS